MSMQTRPQDITIDRKAGEMKIAWLDGHYSTYPLAWIRSNCPCATCREERRENALHPDPLRLNVTPPPSLEVIDAEFVGNYAVRLTWADGHSAGIFPFVALRASCPCAQCNPDGVPPLVVD